MKKLKKFIAMLMLCAFLFPCASYAASGISTGDGSGGDMQVVLCNVLRFVTGGVGKMAASFIIIGVGLGFFTGKASWGLLLGVALGMTALFGSPAIIRAVTGDKNMTTYCDLSK